MTRHLTTLLFAGSLALAGCGDKDGSDTDDKTEGEAGGAEGEAGAPSTPPPAGVDPRLAAPMTLSKAVPASAAVVAVVRAPESLFAAATQLSWLGTRDASADQDLREEIDAFLAERIGVKLTSSRTVTVFFSPKPELAGLIIEGVEGQLSGPEGGRVGDTVLHELGDSDLLAASRDSSLLLGDLSSLTAMLDALDGRQPALVDDGEGVAALLASESAGANLAIAGDVGSLPRDISGPAKQFGIERGYFQISATGVRAVALGDPEALSAAASTIASGVAMALAELEKEKKRAVEGDDVFLGVGAITASHTAKRLAAMVEPEVEGGRMTIDIPLGIADTGAIVAILGVAAAVAVPALQKYMRRSKTVEAKVQLAKLYDAAASYFKSEHVDRSATAFIGPGGEIADLAPHRCPNNGQLSGEAGITPPLSFNCNEGPGGRCIPASGGGGAGYYDIALWTDNPVWNGLNFVQEQGHYFHYNFKWTNEATGYGRCQFTVQAFADLDDDGVFSTYERSGAGDQMGVNAAIGLYIDKEVE